ncbi:MAG: hypothetical protein ACK493_16780 [Planctomycetota bacterium]|jgi:hypothetical protein|nr:hypothetical protein [Blastopirellula sp.]
MLPRYTNSEATSIHGWNDLSDSTPVIVALAALSARAWVEKQPAGEPPLLSREAQVLLAAARERGIFELRTLPTEFDSSDRLLAVSVELPGQRKLVFKQSGNPRQTLRFLDAFRELCQQGLALHQLQKEFSLTSRGFAAADQLAAEDFTADLSFARELDL